MYGYFDLIGACLKNNERSVFNSYYCRLCYCLWNKGGQKARYLTTYDAAVYNLVMAVAGKDERPPCFDCERIKTNNKKHFKDDPIGYIIADLSILGFATKAKDNAAVGDRAKAFFANMFFHGLFKKTIAANGPVFEASCSTIDQMDKLQRENGPIDEVLALYGLTMENSFRYFFEAEDRYFHCINRVARWTFLLDMLEDYNEDRRLKRPNSFIKEDSETIAELFDKHYFELIPFLKKEIDDLKAALIAIKNDTTEWVVLNKLVRHSMATVIPRIINGEDVSFHYFSNTCTQIVNHFDNIKTAKKNEKNPTYYKGN